MSSVTISSLLKSDEERIRSGLKADAIVDKNRRQSVVRLDEALSHILLRYNAAHADDGNRQALADCVTACVREMLDLLLAANARKEIEKRRVRTGAVFFLLFTVICALTAVLLFERVFAAGCALMAVSALSAFVAGRLWYGEREVRVRTELDPELIWKTLKKTADTMDRKTEEFLTQESIRQKEQLAAAGENSFFLTEPEDLKLFGDLLEALYSTNGDYALRQLKKVKSYLRRYGIETLEYTPDHAEMFDVLPTKKEPSTLRPALCSGDRLLAPGKATERVQA